MSDYKADGTRLFSVIIVTVIER